MNVAGVLTIASNAFKRWARGKRVERRPSLFSGRPVVATYSYYQRPWIVEAGLRFKRSASRFRRYVFTHWMGIATTAALVIAIIEVFR